MILTRLANLLFTTNSHITQSLLKVTLHSNVITQHTNKDNISVMQPNFSRHLHGTNLLYIYGSVDSIIESRILAGYTEY